MKEITRALCALAIFGFLGGCASTGGPLGPGASEPTSYTLGPTAAQKPAVVPHLRVTLDQDLVWFNGGYWIAPLKGEPAPPTALATPADQPPGTDGNDGNQATGELAAHLR